LPTAIDIFRRLVMVMTGFRSRRAAMGVE